ncbi:hypothetical protein P9B04_02515, partial [Crocosphaera sp. Alani8]
GSFRHLVRLSGIRVPTPANRGCLGGSERELPKSVEVVMNGTVQSDVVFSFKGTTTEMGTIVVQPTKGSGEKRCLVISRGLGIMRTGVYEPDPLEDSISGENCKKLTES